MPATALLRAPAGCQAPRRSARTSDPALPRHGPIGRPCHRNRQPLTVKASGRDGPSLTPWASPGGPPSRPNAAGSAPAVAGTGDGPSLDLSSGMAGLIALNALVFAGAAFAKLPPLAAMALYNGNGAWWQFVTSAFVHANMAHLSRNMFLLWLWGSVLRREVTGPGVWFAYVISALGANIAAATFLGAKVKTGTALLGVAASGGCAGVALAALALTFRPTLRWLLGAALAVQFTLPALISAPVPFAPAAAGGAAAAGQSMLAKLLPGWMASAAGDVAGAGSLVGAAAAGVGSGPGLGGFVTVLKSPAMSWLWGAAAGALIVVFLARLPVPPE